MNGLLDPSAVEIGSGATLDGTGTIIGNVAMSGTITPGSASAPGTLAIIGDYEQIGTGVFDETISAASSHGLLDVTGEVTLDADSQLEISLLDGFDPYSETVSLSWITVPFSGNFRMGRTSSLTVMTGRSTTTP